MGTETTPELTDAAKAEIAEAVKIVASDKGWAMTKSIHDHLIPPTPENTPPTEGDPTPPPSTEGDPPADPPAKKSGLWWGDRLED